MNIPAAFSNTFAMLRQHFLLFFTLAFAGVVAIEVVEALLFGVDFAAFGPQVDTSDPGALPQMSSGMLLWWMLTQVLFSVLSAVLHLAAWDLMRGAQPVPGAYFARAAALILPLFFLSIVFGLAVGLGLLLLIVPGIYIFGMFIVLVPVIVIEGRGWEAMQRCMELTAGHRWVLGFAYILLFGAILMFGIVVAALTAALGGGLGATLILGTVVNALLLAIFAIFTTEFYAQLVAREG